MIEHLFYLRVVLETLQKQQLFAKISKCIFGVAEVDYLGCVVLGSRVKVDPKKITTMLEWPKPNNLKTLRGFLGLTGYYKKFIKGYGLIEAPLIALLKKNAFDWLETTSKTFQELNRVVTKPSMLSLLDFN